MAYEENTMTIPITPFFMKPAPFFAFSGSPADVIHKNPPNMVRTKKRTPIQTIISPIISPVVTVNGLFFLIAASVAAMSKFCV